MIEPEVFQRYAKYNAWMNGKLYDVCSTLDDDLRKRDQGAFFKSIHSTLNHILFGDRAWMGRFTGRDYEIKPIGVDLYEDFEVLRAARTEMDQDILDWTSGLGRPWLERSLTWTSGSDGKTRSQVTWQLVLHMFNHQTHHRGQLTTLFSQQGLDIGPTDMPWMPDT
ncbi:DinB family protein [Denitrobaculum tricleocarpae]|uniref:Damage-inducible protein DinB n=1 Tax=Denitrobaculum tricleocarpae TaxID=2591009 RepID=A0A545U1C4_9PROT|nr:DinB family protein [Denitrobaculum tricleocarpae]TQV83258.1 damage-inducible protein DinB [Denitrobaculum tricleocarpae]